MKGTDITIPDTRIFYTNKTISFEVAGLFQGTHTYRITLSVTACRVNLVKNVTHSVCIWTVGGK